MLAFTLRMWERLDGTRSGHHVDIHQVAGLNNFYNGIFHVPRLFIAKSENSTPKVPVCLLGFLHVGGAKTIGRFGGVEFHESLVIRLHCCQVTYLGEGERISPNFKHGS